MCIFNGESLITKVMTNAMVYDINYLAAVANISRLSHSVTRGIETKADRVRRVIPLSLVVPIK